jgi:HAAS
VTSPPAPRPADTGQPVECYLAELAALLPGPAGAHAEIVAELRAGLLDAIDAHIAAGINPAAAAEAAVTEFGAPRQVAGAFGAELAARQARRVAATVLGTAPLIALLWAAASVASHVGVHYAPPWQWSGTPPGAPLAFPLLAAAGALADWSALFTLATTGRLSRWLPTRPAYGPAAAAAAGYGAAAADLVLLALLASQLAAAPATLAPLPIAAAAAASLTRLTLAPRAARRCLTARAALA